MSEEVQKEVQKKPKGFQKKKKESVVESEATVIPQEEVKPEISPLPKEMPEVVQIPEPPKVVLSLQAEKWRDYLNMQRLTPERFLEKYPVHPSRKFVEEILRFNKNTD
jgi:hypothetical protein